MSIQDENVRVTYDCDGSTVDFAFEFKIFSEDDIDVILTDSGGTATTLTITTDYTVEGENGAFESGGTVTTVKEVDGEMAEYAWAEGYKITIVLNLPLSQETSLPYGGTLPSASIINALDKLTKICQQLNDAIKRSVTLATDSPLSSLTIPDLVAGRYLYASDAETLGWATSVDTTAITVSDFAKTFLDDLDASAVLTTLGISTFIKTLLDDTDSPTALKTLLSAFHTSIPKAASYTVTTADRGKLINFDCTAGNLACDLPAAATAGNGFVIAVKKTDSSANYVDICPDGAEEIDGNADHIISLQNSVVICVCDGTGWKTVANSEGIDALKDPAASTAGLRTLGTGATQAVANNDARLSDERTPLNASVSQSKLKTSQGSVNINVAGGTEIGDTVLTLPGGEYGFYPRFRLTLGGTSGKTRSCHARLDTTSGTSVCDTGYITHIVFWASFSSQGPDSGNYYAQQRYVTSSGEVFWVFILRDKTTKDVIAAYQAPDHPCFGNGGKPLLVPHPFGSYDEATQEIVVINPTKEEIERMELETIVDDETMPDKDLLEVIAENYEIDEDSNPPWPTEPVTVGLPKHVIDRKSGKKVLADYRFMSPDTVVKPIKKVIPRPAGVLTKSLRKKMKGEQP